MRKEFIILVPDSISDKTAAQLVINPSTIIGMLDEQDVPKGDYLIQTVAGSMLGRYLLKNIYFQIHPHLIHRFFSFKGHVVG